MIIGSFVHAIESATGTVHFFKLICEGDVIHVLSFHMKNGERKSERETKNN